MSRDPLSFAASFPAVEEPAERGRRWPYSTRLARIRNRTVSGVYAFYDARTRRLLYIGESHTGRLYDTITRHFRAWEPTDDPQGRRFGGTQYDRKRIRVAIQTMPAHQAQDHQYAAIIEMEPRDNVVGFGMVDLLDDDDAPF